MELITTFGLPILISAVIAYLLGSISFAIPVTKLFTGKDIRTMGSGNAGFTNVLRCVSIPAAVITFIGDFAKGICSVFIGEMVFNLMCPGVPDIDSIAKVVRLRRAVGDLQLRVHDERLLALALLGQVPDDALRLDALDPQRHSTIPHSRRGPSGSPMMFS